VKQRLFSVRQQLLPGGTRFPSGFRVPLLVGSAAVMGALFFFLPLLGLVVQVPWEHVWEEATAPEIRTALRLSLVTSLSATAFSFLFGVPLAWVQARGSFRGRSLLRGLTTFPIVFPPVVGGVALLSAFGRNGLVGEWIYEIFDIRLSFTLAGAVLSATFVSMPFMVTTMEGAFRSLDTRCEEAARTLGASPWTVFWRVTLPMVRPSLVAGGVLVWGRALGEFGATITFAGNFPGRTQTLPLTVFLALQSRPETALVLSFFLLLISFAVMIGLRRRFLEVL